MKVSINWLKELVNLNCSIKQLLDLLPLKSISIKEVGENFFELDMKGYNRADLLSLRGVAQEVSAITGSELAFDNLKEAKFVWEKQNLPSSPINIEAPNLAPFYTITKITGLKVKKSPKEWVEKLRLSGMRSVNNITDITNLIMLEYGQPLHAFDAQSVKNEEIVVRTAREGEKITTLDGKERSLQPADLLIADLKKALGIAGVMGGKNSEVGDNTTSILLEAAIFDPVNIRKTASRLNLPSEASKRFQHGLTKKRLLQALDAAIKMYQQLGGKIVSINMAGGFEDQQRVVKLTPKKLDDLIGIKIPAQRVESDLKSLGFHLRGGGSNQWEITPPYWRLDVKIEEDLIEEVARMYGYEKISPRAVSPSKPLQNEDPIFKTIADLKTGLVNLGFSEVQTYSFYSTAVLNALGTEKFGNTLIQIANPISSETEYLRENLWPNLVEAVGKNLKKGFKDIAIFEVGKIHYFNEKKEVAEKYGLSIALMNGTDNPLTELYQIFTKLNQQLNLQIKEVYTGNKVNLAPFHPNRFVQLGYQRITIGALAQIHQKVTDKLGISQRVAIFEVGFTKLLSPR